MIPLKDNVPTARFPILTVLLIAANLAVFVWQTSLSSDPGSSTDPKVPGLSAYDKAVIEYGAIPDRLSHPGEECGVTTAQAGARVDRKDTIVCGADDVDRVEANAGVDVVPLDAPPWWVTVLTSMFMHGGLLHFGFNMLFLWIFGNNVEDSMGRPRFLLFYVLAGIAAVYAQVALDPDATTPTIGASGAIAGVLGGYMLLHPRARVLTLVIVIFFVTLIEIPALILLGIWFALQFIPAVGQVATPEVASAGGGVAYFAHVGGFIFGLLAIKLFANRKQTAAY